MISQADRLIIKAMFKRNVLLNKYSNYKIGGPAKYFFEARNVKEIIKAVKKARQMKARIFILGGGTNILFSDKGFNGLVIKIKNDNLKFSAFGGFASDGKIIKVDAGVPLAKAVEAAMKNNLTGLEWAAGIPGTVGGAIRGNAGAFDGEMQNLIKEIVSLDISKTPPKIKKRNRNKCHFGYRSSIFKKSAKKEIIIEAIFELKTGDKKSIKRIMGENVNYREKHHPLEYPSIGSIFKNVRSIPAAYLIAESGLKGISCGGAMISPKHPNFIVNTSNAAANDVKKLIKLIKREVFKKFKIKLEEEAMILE